MQTVARFCSMVRAGAVVIASAGLAFGGAVAHAQTAPTTTTPEPASPDETAPESDSAPPSEAEPTETAPQEETQEPQEAPPPDTVSPVVAPIEAEPPPPPPPAPPAPKSHVASYIMWGVGAASLAVGTVYGVMALQAKKDFDDKPTYDGADKTENRAIVSDVALGAGLILAITGTVFYFVKDEPRDTAAASKSTKQRLVRNDLRVQPYVGARTGGGTLSLRF